MFENQRMVRADGRGAGFDLMVSEPQPGHQLTTAHSSTVWKNLGLV
jgi:hypothetical protein